MRALGGCRCRPSPWPVRTWPRSAGDRSAIFIWTVTPQLAAELGSCRVRLCCLSPCTERVADIRSILGEGRAPVETFAVLQVADDDDSRDTEFGGSLLDPRAADARRYVRRSVRED